MKQSAVSKLTNLIETRVKSLKTEPGAERIIVPDLVNLVVVYIQPLEGLGDEGKVKPLKCKRININSLSFMFYPAFPSHLNLICGDVEPL